MKLSDEQKLHMYEKGYVKVPGAIPQVMIDRTLRAINHSVGQGMPVEQMPQYRAGSFCPDIRNEPVVTDLINRTPAFQLAESVIGEGQLKPVRGGQVALRFPSMQDRAKPPSPHLDGMYSEHNGVQSGTYHNFTMLIGVYLSDVQTDYAGNFTVWPGSHRVYEQYFREHGTDVLLKGMPPVPIGEPEQLTVRAGDIVLCHYQVGHGSAVNMSPNVRYALYFRLKHVDHDNVWKETYSDIWRHWPGIRDIVEK